MLLSQYQWRSFTPIQNNRQHIQLSIDRYWISKACVCVCVCVCVFKYVRMYVNWCFLSSRMLQGYFIHIMHQRAGFVFCSVFVYSIPTSVDLSTNLVVRWFAFFMLHHSASSVEGTALEWITYNRTVWGPHTTWRSDRRKMSWIYCPYCSICQPLWKKQFPHVSGGWS